MSQPSTIRRYDFTDPAQALAAYQILSRWFARRVQDPDVRLDLTQDAYVKSAQLSYPVSAPLLYRIAQNVKIDYLRARAGATIDEYRVGMFLRAKDNLDPAFEPEVSSRLRPEVVTRVRRGLGTTSAMPERDFRGKDWFESVDSAALAEVLFEAQKARSGADKAVLAWRGLVAIFACPRLGENRLSKSGRQLALTRVARAGGARALAVAYLGTGENTPATTALLAPFVVETRAQASDVCEALLVLGDAADDIWRHLAKAACRAVATAEKEPALSDI